MEGDEVEPRPRANECVVVAALPMFTVEWQHSMCTDETRKDARLKSSGD